MELSSFGAVAFDFDGTLAKTDLHIQARKKAYLEMAEKLDDPRYAQVPDELHLSAGRLATTALGINAIILASQEIIPQPDSLAPPVLSVVKCKEAKYLEMIQKGQDEIPGATYFLKRLSVYKPGRIGIVTTAHDWEVSPFLLRHKLNPYIPRHRLIAKEDLTSPENTKPNPEAYETFIGMGHMALKDPSDCLVFEDSPLGIEAAKRAGTVVIGMALDGNLRELSALEGEYKPDAIVESYNELSALLGMGNPRKLA